MLQENVMMLSHRILEKSDAEAIAKFPQSKEELFYMFPKAEYPLNPNFLLKEAELRLYPTVAMLDRKLVGYGNFIYAKHSDFCSIGNVVVNPATRKMGIASYLVKTLVAIAFDKMKAKFVKISCFNNNTAGLLLYHKLDFSPFDMETRQSRSGQRVALIHMRKYAT